MVGRSDDLPSKQRSHGPALQAGMGRLEDVRPLREEWHGLILPWTMSIAAHLVFAGLFWFFSASAERMATPPHVFADVVELAESEPPGPEAVQVRESRPQAEGAATSPLTVHSESIPARASPPNISDVLSESQLAGMARADDEAGDGGAGGDGGGCHMARAVQHALQRDPLVQTAVEGADRLGKTIMLWDGDWVRAGEQDGRGLAAVREAVIWTVAFAPEACRNQPMRGPVLLSLSDGVTRFAIGMSDWRWADLLGLHDVDANR